jgi:hypothetical protein
LAERLLDMQYGMAWTNAVIEAETGKHLYCPPESALNGEQLVDMLRKKAAEDPRLNNISFGLAILSTLRMTFPCAEKSN